MFINLFFLFFFFSSRRRHTRWTGDWSSDVCSSDLLQDTLTNLQQTQTELMQAQKLESVGRLASGIAHEINTPIQFVSDSVLFVQEACADLFRLLRTYAELRAAAAAGPVDPALLARVEEAERTADLDYLTENVPRSLE